MLENDSDEIWPLAIFLPWVPEVSFFVWGWGGGGGEREEVRKRDLDLDLSLILSDPDIFLIHPQTINEHL